MTLITMGNKEESKIALLMVRLCDEKGSKEDMKFVCKRK